MVQKKLRGRPPKDEGSRTADRQILIDAAVQILNEGGSSAFSARHVAEKAGTAVGSVYTQFESLEALRLEAGAVTMRLLRATLTDSLAGSAKGSTEQRLLCLAEAYLRFAAEHHNAWAALFERRTIEAPPAIAADITALFAILEDVLLSAAVSEPRDIPVIARALWSSVHGIVYLGEIGGLGPIGPSDIQPMIKVLIKAVVSGLGQAS
jgi:AcrR family transcriptional regulator